MERNRHRAKGRGDYAAPQAYSPQRYHQQQQKQQQQRYHQASLQQQQQQSYYYSQQQQQQQQQNYYSQQYLAPAAAGYHPIQQQALGGYPQQAPPQYYYQPQPQRRRPADPPAPVQYSESVTGFSDGIQLSERQLELLAKRNRRASPPQTCQEEDESLQQQQHQSTKPFQTRSNISQGSIQSTDGVATAVISPKTQQASKPDEDQRKLLRSMMPGKKDNKVLGSFKDDPGKVLLKKFLNQQKTRVGKGSNLSEQLRERLFQKRSTESANSPKKTLSTKPKRVDLHVQTSTSLSSQISERDSSTALSQPKRSPLPSAPLSQSASLPSAPEMSETYKQFMNTLQREVSSTHSLLYASFEKSVGADGIPQRSPTVSKLDDQTIAQVQVLQTLLKSKYEKSIVECRKVTQMVNDKKYTREKRTLAKKGVKKKPATTSNNLMENDKQGARKPTSEPGIAAAPSMDDTEKSDDVERITDHPVTAPKIGTSTEAATSPEIHPQEKREISKPKYVEENGIIHVEYQDLPTFSEDPILQTRSTESVTSSTGSRRPNLQVAIPASTEDSGKMSFGTDSNAPSTRSASREVATGTEQRKSLPPPGTSPIPWVGVQLRSVSEARDAEENRAEKAPSWASVNLRPVTQKHQDSSRSQNVRVGFAADSPIVVDSDSQSARNNFPPCTPSESASSCVTGPQQVRLDERAEAKSTSSDETEIEGIKLEPKDDEESPETIAQPNDDPKPTMNFQDDRPIDDDVVVIRLKNDAANDKNEHRVIIGKKMVRRIRNNPGGSNAVVCWNLPREDMEHDGMTLNMPTLKVTLLLKKGKGSCKVLSFQNAADCLRFATAFYNMTGLDSARDKSVPPISEISDTASDVNSSVRLESLNDEEQNVLERYRELRQTNSAKDALNETISQSSQSRAGTTVSVVAASPEEEELLQKYRKMIKLGMPLGAVQHKMKLDNAPPQIQKAVTEDSVNVVPPSFVDALPTSPVSTFTATTVGDGEKLTEEEEKVAERYRLLLKRGLTPDAVRHKLARDNVDIKIVHAVFGESGATAAATTSTANATHPPAGPRLSESENVIAEKYRKMLKMRIPADAVRHKMTQDQVDAKIVAAVLNEEKPATAPATKVEESKGKATAKMSAKALSEEEESIASQYRKMLKLQIPREAVLSRMEKEGVSEKIITAVVGPRALASKPSNDASTVSGSTSSNLINLHWNAMDDVPAGSVWEETSKKSTEPERSDISTLVALFQKKKPSTIREEKKADAAGSNSKARLLDLTRSNNLAISLKAFKEFSHQELAYIIGFLDPTRKIRGERVQFIRDLLPTAPEMKIISEYNGSDERLVPAELWFRHLRGIMRLETKAQVLRTMEMFTSEIKAVESSFRLLNEVCHQVMGSVKLQDLLGMVLRIGNVMNEGTRTGGAAGFRFDSLLRLTQTKTSDGKITVLDYLVTVFVAKGQRDTLDLESDFPECHTASRLLISDMSNEVKLLKESLEQCKSELKDLERDQAPPPKKVNGSVTSASDDPRGQLFASILSRANSNENEDLPPRPPGPRVDVSAKRDAFLAAIASKAPKTPSVPLTKPKRSPEKVEPEVENTLAGGTTRLRNFIAGVEESLSHLEKKRTDTLEACKDLSKYCGESGGVGSTIMLLGVLSEFAKNIKSALKKYDQKQERHARKQKPQDTREIRTSSSSESSQAVDENEKKPSLILLVSDVLKNSNPQFKDDFKKGRTLPNPSKPLKAIYEREASAIKLTEKLDIVSAIREREGEINEDDGLQQHARTTFAGARRYSFDMKKTDEAEIAKSSEQFVSVKDRASFLTAAHRSQSAAPEKQLAVTNPQPVTDSAPEKKFAVTKPQPATEPTALVVPKAKETSSSADPKPTVKQGNPSVVSSSPPITNNSHAEYRTRTPPLPTGKPLRPSLPSSGSGSKPKERKSIFDRARERRLEKKSAARSASTDRRSTIAGSFSATESQKSPAQSAREKRLQRLSK